MDLATVLIEQLKAHLGASRWILAYSGGHDSTALLHLLAEYCQCNTATPELLAVHINHQLQEQSPQWVEHCQQQCAALAVPLTVCAVNVERSGVGEEAAARAARYACFEQLLKAGDVLLLAHHLDDQVETFFLRALRGSGVRGLAGMPVQRPLGEGVLLRPLLSVTGENLQAYNRQHRLTAISDPANSSARYDRSFLRQQVLPLLEARWPAYRATVSRSMGHLRTSEERGANSNFSLQRCRSVLGDEGLSLRGMEALPAADTALVIRNWLQALGLSMPATAPLNELVRQLRDGSKHHARLGNKEWQLEYFDGALYLLPAPIDAPAPVRLKLNERCRIAGVGVLSLQPCEPGQRGIEVDGCGVTLGFRQLGASQKSLKKRMQEQRIPPWWRCRLPLLYRGEQLLALADLHWCSVDDVAPAQLGERRWRLHWERETTK